MVRTLPPTAAIAAAVLCVSMPAGSAADFYAGKTIEMVVGSDVGGGYDVYARAIARHLSRHIPGNPMIVVKNLPGAGSGRAATYAYSVAANWDHALSKHWSTSLTIAGTRYVDNADGSPIVQRRAFASAIGAVTYTF